MCGAEIVSQVYDLCECSWVPDNGDVLTEMHLCEHYGDNQALTKMRPVISDQR